MADCIGTGCKLESMRTELDQLRANAARYLWLRERLLAVDWDYMGTGDTVLVFTAPAEMTVSADCDATIDSAMQAVDA